MRRKKRPLLKAFAVVIAVIFVLISAGLIVMANLQQRATEEKLNKLQKQAAPYEKQIHQLKLSIEDKERQIDAEFKIPRAVVAYKLSNAGQLSVIEEDAEKYGFEPVLILDCAQDNVSELISDLSTTNYELILDGDLSSEEQHKRAQDIRSQLAANGMNDTGCFYLRKKNDTTLNIALLHEDDYAGALRYAEAMCNAVTDEGLPCVNYFSIQRNSQDLKDWLDKLAMTDQTLVITFDLNRLDSGKLKRTAMTTYLDLLKSRVDKDIIHYDTMKNSIYLLANQKKIIKANKKEYAKFRKQQLAKIAELEAKVDEIYSHWNESRFDIKDLFSIFENKSVKIKRKASAGSAN